jgi:hypothetical protein
VFRSALFALVGVVFFAHWELADPSFEATASQSEWKFVVFFSAAILGLAISLPVFARLAGGRIALTVSFIAAGGAALASVWNVVEDGLDRQWAFFVTASGTGLLLVGLAGLAAAISFGRRGYFRLLALIPVGTIGAVLLYVHAGGPLMLVTWSIAALLALVVPHNRRFVPETF